MSVLIKGLNIKPCKDGFGGKGLVIIGYDDKLYAVAHEQIIPLPDHGDLIARDALYERTAEWEAQALHMCEVTMQDEDTTEWKRWSTILTERSAFKYDVADAPTVIPAERSEDAQKAD